jgi:hypothetical protein
MTKTLTAAASAVLMLSLGACSGGSDGSSSDSSSSSSASTSSSASASATGDEATAASSISDSLVRAQKASGTTSSLLAVNRRDADCIGAGFVDRIGIAKLQEYGLLTKDLEANENATALKMSAPDAATAAKVTTGCTDIKSRIIKAISSTGALPKKAKDCLKRSFRQSDIRAALTAAFQGDQTGAQEKVTGPLLKCSKVAPR